MRELLQVSNPQLYDMCDIGPVPGEWHMVLVRFHRYRKSSQNFLQKCFCKNVFVSGESNSNGNCNGNSDRGSNGNSNCVSDSKSNGSSNSGSNGKSDRRKAAQT